MTSPVLRQCKTAGCRAWVEIDVCPYCGKSDRAANINRWVDRIVITASVVGTVALGWYIVGRL